MKSEVKHGDCSGEWVLIGKVPRLRMGELQQRIDGESLAASLEYVYGIARLLPPNTIVCKDDL